MEKCHTIVRSYQGFHGRKPLLRNLLQFFDGAEKYRSKVDLTDIRHLNSPKLLKTTVSKALWKGKGKKNAFQEGMVRTKQEQITRRM